MTDWREQRTADLLARLDAERDAGSPPALTLETTRLAARHPERELARLRGIRAGLRALPDPEPDPRLWARIRARAGARQLEPDQVSVRVGRRSWGRWPLAAAAAVCLMLGLIGLRLAGPTPGAARDAAGESGASQELASLYRRSQRLESLLQGGRALRGDASERALLYRIADLDSQLEAVPASDRRRLAERTQLWEKRVATLESLAEVRRTRAAVRPALAVY